MKTLKVKSINKVSKGKKEDKVARVMREFSEGKLKDSHGKTVTDKNQAIAIAMSEAGLSNKSLQKAEIRNKLRMYRSDLNNILKKELMNDKSIKAEIIKLFKQDKPIADSDVHALAERLQISPDKMEEQIYNILRSFLSGGMSQGKVEDVDSDELAMGIKVESEHTDDPVLQEKIARDHLKEDAKYYTKLKEIEKQNTYEMEKARSVEGYESPEPGDLPEEGKKILASTYASCRKDGGDKEKCAKIAWSAVNKAGFKSVKKQNTYEMDKSGAPAMAPVIIQKPIPAIQKPIRPAMDMEAEELAKELPGDIPREAEELFSKIYAACRKGGGDKMSCSQIAWSEIRNAGFSK